MKSPTEKLIRCFVFLCLPLLLPQQGPAAEAPETDEILALAREFYGGDEVLEKIESLHYRGRFETSAGAEGEVDIYLKKPLYQRVDIKYEDMIEVTSLDRDEAWRRVQSRDDPTQWAMEILDARRIRELQASTWESLNYFSGIEERRGRIENEGTVQIEDYGECVKLVFHHRGNVFYNRYFKPDTGELVMTVTSAGNRIVEEGGQVVEGIRFPESWTMYEEGGEFNRINFEEISVNPDLDKELFELPSLAR